MSEMDETPLEVNEQGGDIRSCYLSSSLWADLKSQSTVASTHDANVRAERLQPQFLDLTTSSPYNGSTPEPANFNRNSVQFHIQVVVSPA